MTVSARALFLAFARVSVVSVGGGTTAWIRHVVVERCRWLTEEEFAESLAVCQVLPGPNTLNLATFLGSRLGGHRGAVASTLGLTLFPFLLVLTLGILYGHVTQGPTMRAVMAGFGAGAVGVSLGTGLQMARKNLKDRWLLASAVCVFLCLALLRLPIPVALLVSAMLAGGGRR